MIMPAYNEAHSLENTVLHTMKTFELLDLDFEIIIIDDNSSDRTGDIAKMLASSYNYVSCFRHKENQGSGEAFRTGIAHATKKYLIFVPVDNPLDTEDMEAYLPRMGVCDIVAGCRVERVGYSGFFRFASFVYNRILIPLLFNIGLSDVGWIQVYRRELFTNGTIHFNKSRIFWLVEILVQARKKRLIIAEVPARMKKRLHGKPTIVRPYIIAETLFNMIKFFWAENVRGKNP